MFAEIAGRNVVSSWHTCRAEPIANTKVMICPSPNSVFGTIRTRLGLWPPPGMRQKIRSLFTRRPDEILSDVEQRAALIPRP